MLFFMQFIDLKTAKTDQMYTINPKQCCLDK